MRIFLRVNAMQLKVHFGNQVFVFAIVFGKIAGIAFAI